MRAIVLIVATLLSVARPARAEVSLAVDVESGLPPALFSNGMILQRELSVPVFGKAAPGEMVTVSFNGQQKVTTTGLDGRWSVELDPMPAGGPFDMTIEGNNTIVIGEVRVGEVWVAAGQSNMTRRRIRRSVLEANPTIRTLGRRDWNDKPGITPYTFAQRLQTELGVPIGILNLASGGSNVVAWLGETTSTDSDPEVAQYLIGDWGYLYRRFIKPLLPYRIRGVIWWQGEADLKRPDRHRTLLPALMRSWRTEWGLGDFPWISMQVPAGRGLQAGATPDVLPANPSADDMTAFMRQTYVVTLAELPATSFVSSLDLEGGVHPVDTDTYAGRFADQALALVYGQSLAYSGPVYSSMTIEPGAIRIHYRANTADGLVAQGGALQGFAITEDNLTWHWAEAEIQGEEVVLSSPSAPDPIAARYAWANRPTWANLFNGAGLGAAAFATDVTPGEY